MTPTDLIAIDRKSLETITEAAGKLCYSCWNFQIADLRAAIHNAQTALNNKHAVVGKSGGEEGK